MNNNTSIKEYYNTNLTDAEIYSAGEYSDVGNSNSPSYQPPTEQQSPIVPINNSNVPTSVEMHDITNYSVNPIAAQQATENVNTRVSAPIQSNMVYDSDTGKTFDVTNPAKPIDITREAAYVRDNSGHIIKNDFSNINNRIDESNQNIEIQKAMFDNKWGEYYNKEKDTYILDKDQVDKFKSDKDNLNNEIDKYNRLVDNSSNINTVLSKNRAEALVTLSPFAKSINDKDVSYSLTAAMNSGIKDQTLRDAGFSQIQIDTGKFDLSKLKSGSGSISTPTVIQNAPHAWTSDINLFGWQPFKPTKGEEWAYGGLGKMPISKNVGILDPMQAFGVNPVLTSANWSNMTGEKTDIFGVQLPSKAAAVGSNIIGAASVVSLGVGAIFSPEAASATAGLNKVPNALLVSEALEPFKLSDIFSPVVQTYKGASTITRVAGKKAIQTGDVVLNEVGEFAQNPSKYGIGKIGEYSGGRLQSDVIGTSSKYEPLIKGSPEPTPAQIKAMGNTSVGDGKVVKIEGLGEYDFPKLEPVKVRSNEPIDIKFYEPYQVRDLIPDMPNIKLPTNDTLTPRERISLNNKLTELRNNMQRTYAKGGVAYSTNNPAITMSYRFNSLRTGGGIETHVRSSPSSYFTNAMTNPFRNMSINPAKVATAGVLGGVFLTASIVSPISADAVSPVSNISQYNNINNPVNHDKQKTVNANVQIVQDTKLKQNTDTNITNTKDNKQQDSKQQQANKSVVNVNTQTISNTQEQTQTQQQKQQQNQKQQQDQQQKQNQVKSQVQQNVDVQQEQQQVQRQQQQQEYRRQPQTIKVLPFIPLGGGKIPGPGGSTGFGKANKKQKRYVSFTTKVPELVVNLPTFDLDSGGSPIVYGDKLTNRKEVVVTKSRKIKSGAKEVLGVGTYRGRPTMAHEIGRVV